MKANPHPESHNQPSNIPHQLKPAFFLKHKVEKSAEVPGRLKEVPRRLEHGFKAWCFMSTAVVNSGSIPRVPLGLQFMWTSSNHPQY